MKGVVERVCAGLGLAPSFTAVERPWLVPGRAASVSVTAVGGDGGPVLAGSMGQLAPHVAEARGLPPDDAVYVAELDVDAVAHLASLGEDVSVRPLPRYPSVVRDISIIVAEGLPAAALRATIQQAAPPTLVHVREFARYRGKGVPEGYVSLSFRLTYRARDRTLTDAEVQAATDGIIAALAAAHGAKLR
jgi:phenylalanyl-tRNA synthetase beta chain